MTMSFGMRSMAPHVPFLDASHSPVHRVPLAAVHVLVAGEGARRRVQLRVAREQGPGVLRPRLMAEALELGDHTDAALLAGLHEVPRRVSRDEVLGVPQLRMGL